MLDVRQNIESIYPLTPVQQAMLSHSIEAGETGVYLLQMSCRLTGPLDAAAYREAWRTVQQRQPLLRTSFYWGRTPEPMQVVQREVPLPLHEHDWRARTAQEQEQALVELRETQLAAGVDLKRAPLWRLDLVRLDDHEHVQVWLFHHSLMEGWSASIVLQEVGQVYAALLSGRNIELAPAPEFRQFVSWLRAQDHSASERYWRDRLADFSESATLALPSALESGRRRPQDNWIEHVVEANVLERLRYIVRREELTLNTLLQGAWAVLLSRYQNEERVLFGSVVSGREFALPQIETLVGLCVSNVPMPVRVAPERPVCEWLREFQVEQAQMRRHAAAGLAQIQRWSNLPAGQRPFDTMLALDVLGESAAVRSFLPGVKVWDLRTFQGVTDVPLSVIFTAGRDLEIHAACGAQFDRVAVGDLLRHYETLLADIARRPDSRIRDLEVLPPAERQRILAEWNQTASVYPRESSIQELFEQQVRARPDAVAVVYDAVRMTYDDLNRRANRLAHYLRARGIGRDMLVGLHLERGCDLIVAMLAILKAGGAYLPLDEAYPLERIAFMLEDGQAAVVITETVRHETVRAAIAAMAAPPEILCIDSSWDPEGRFGESDPACDTSTDDLAYVIYTSGSTGQPKGVAIPHRGVVRLVRDSDYVALGPDERVAQASNASFDAATFEIWGALLNGGQVVGIDRETSLSPERLSGTLATGQVTTLFLTTALFNQVARHQPSAFRAVRNVLFGGEAVDPQWVRAVLAAGPPERLLHVYGPTENTTFSTWELVRVVVDGARTIPIGRPLANSTAYVLDAWQRPAPRGAVGELYLGGDGLARCYWRSAELTAERFVTLTLPEVGSQRLYRTGDLVRQEASGAFTFIGRNDHQVKIRGFRIELPEIEHALEGLEMVREALVLCREDQPGRKRLVAYLVPRVQGASPTAELRQLLSSRLPEYMIPSAFVWLAEFPLNANGKVDRRALPSPELDAQEPAGVDDEPRNETERTLARIWADVLGVPRVGRGDNFFELGGDSIVGIQVSAKAREAGLRVSARQLFEHQTVEMLAAALRPHDTVRGVVVTDEDDDQLTPIEHWFFEQKLAAPHHFNQALRLTVGGDFAAETVQRALEALVAAHPSLRGAYEDCDGRWRPRRATDVGPLRFERVELGDMPDEAAEIEVLRRADALHAAFDLRRSPLLAAAWFDRAGRRAELLLVAHHLATDGVSWRILLADLEGVGAALQRGETFAPAPGACGVRRWARELAVRANRADVQAEIPLWVAQQGDVTLPCDFGADDAANTFGRAARVSTALDEATTRKLLRAVSAAGGMRARDVLVAALAQVLCEWCERDEIVVDLESHGRELSDEDVDLSRTVGWLTAMHPLRLTRDRTHTPAAALRHTSQQLAAVPHDGVHFGALRYLASDADVRSQLAALPQPQIAFNYLGAFDRVTNPDGPFRLAAPSAGRLCAPENRRKHRIDVDALVLDGRLWVHWTYGTAFHTAATMERVAERFVDLVREWMSHATGGPAARGAAIESAFTLIDPAMRATVLQRYPTAEDAYPLSPMQTGMLFHTLRNPDSSAYHEQLVCTLGGDLDEDAWQGAWDLAFARHPALRSVFMHHDAEQLGQVVLRDVTLTWAHEDWRGLDPVEQSARLEALLKEDRGRAFVFDQAPLMRGTLLRTGAHTSQLVWSFHHILMDGWSVARLLEEVTRAYEALAAGRGPTLPAAPAFSEFISWQSRQDRQKATEYWAEALDGIEPAELCLVPPAVMVMEPEPLWLDLPEDLCVALRDCASRCRVTVYTVFQAAWALLLSQYTGRDDVVFGVTVAGRPADLAHAERMVGVFINTLPARVRVQPELRVDEWLRAILANQLRARDFEHTPLAQIQSQCGLTGDQNLFDTLLVYENYPIGDSLRSGGAALEWRTPRMIERSNYPLSVSIMPGTRLTLQVIYDGARFDRAAVGRLAGRFRRVLHTLCTADRGTLAEVETLTADEQTQLLAWGETRGGYPREVGVVELFAEQVAARPDAPAVFHADRNHTYAELARWSDGVAAALQRQGVLLDTPVALYAERSAALIAGMLGILKCGVGYLPLELSYPAERLRYLLTDGRVRLLLAERARLADVERVLGPLAGSIAVVVLEDCAAAEAQPVVKGGGPDSLAYVMYTSGSTGQPKGVAIPQRGIVRLVRDPNYVTLGPSDRILHGASPAFDASTFEVWGALLNGGSVIVAPREVMLAPERLAQLLADQRITVVWLTTALFNQLMQEVPGLFRGIRYVLFGGEAVDVRWARAALGATGPERLIHCYGPTECTTFATCYEVREIPDQARTVPIGPPISGTTTYVVDRSGRLVPPETPGELWIGGDGVALGYWQDPEVTARKFRTVTFRGRPERVYCTGDQVRWNSAGALEFIGRLDGQIKIRGFRIELGEIQARLQQQAGVSQAVVVCREDRPGQRRIVGYYCGVAEGAELRAALSRELPDYMVPTGFVRLETIPVNPNGKVDQRGLPAPETTAHDEFIGPRTPIESQLAELWSEVLNVERVGVRDNFFALGGDSILSIHLAARAARGGLKISVREIFESPDLAALAAVAVPVVPAALAIEPEAGDVSLSPVQAWFFERDLGELHHFNQAVLLSASRSLALDVLQRAVGAVLARHEILRARFSHIEGEWRQVIGDAQPVVAEVDLSTAAADSLAAAVTAECARLQARLALDSGALLQVVLFRTPAGECERLFIVAHHLVVDVVSWRILLEDLESAYAAFEEGGLPELGPQTTSFAQWTRRLVAHAVRPETVAELAEWRTIAAGVRPLPRDLRAAPAANTHATAEAVRVQLTEEDTTRLLRRGSRAGESRVHEMLLGALTHAVARWSEQEAVAVAVESHGRPAVFDDLDVTRTVGWFTSIYPQLLPAVLKGGPRDTLRAVRARVRHLRESGFSYGLLRHLNPQARAELEAYPEPELSFNYLGRLDQIVVAGSLFTPAGESFGPCNAARQRRTHLLTVNAWIASGQLEVQWIFSSAHHETSTIARVARDFVDALRAIADDATDEVTVADFPLADLDDAGLLELRRRYGEVEDVYPLSPAQEGMLYHALAMDVPDAYLNQVQYVLSGVGDVTRLRAAWQQVLRHHPILRTVFVWSGLERARQVVLAEPELAWTEDDWRDLQHEARHDALLRHLQQERHRGFDVSVAPPLRVHAARVGADAYQLALTFHHLVLDGWSLPLLLEQVHECHAALAAGREWRPPRGTRFADYIAWLRQQDIAAGERFWIEQLGTVESATPVPYARRARTPAPPGHAVRTLSLAADETAELQHCAQERRITLGTLAAAAWGLLLARHACQDEAVFGLTVSGRPPELPDVDRAVGMYINVLPQRVVCPPEQSIATWLDALHRAQRALRRYEYMPLSAIQRCAAVPHGTNLFETLLTIENYVVADSLRDTRQAYREHELEVHQATNYALAVTFVPGDRLQIRVTYDRVRIDEALVPRLLDQLRLILKSIARSSDTSLGDLQWFDAEERERTLAAARGPVCTCDPVETLPARFARHAQSFPDAPAVISPAGSFSHHEIDRRARVVAAALTARGVQSGAAVAVCTERDADLVTSLVAIWRLGAVYVPLDPGHPAARMQLVLDDVQAAAVLTQERLLASLPTTNVPVLCLDRDWAELCAAPPVTFEPVRPDQLAYILYTSGSTGQPKGVCIEHGALANFVHAYIERLALPLHTRYGMASTIAADLASGMLFLALGCGGCVVLVPDHVVGSVDDLAAFLASYPVDAMKFVPSHLEALLAAGAGGEILPRMILIVAGEACSWELIDRVRGLVPELRIVNSYGPTETTVSAVTHEFQLSDPHRDLVAPPIGRPLANVRAHVLDSRGRPLPVAVPGELHIGGEGVARGYLNRPELTAERFVRDPFAGITGARLYRTGDRAVLLSDGSLEFVGRADNQLKLRGYRVEPGEIEAVLRGHPEVARCAVVSHNGPGQPVRLVGYVVPRGDTPPPADELRGFLATRLPEYMIPAAFMHLDELPLSATGKLNRAALPAPDIGPMAVAEPLAPRTPREVALAAIWQKVLRVERVGVYDNFFDLGGDSILSIQIIARASQAGLRITPRQVFECQTVAALAEVAEQVETATGTDVPYAGDMPLTPIQLRFLDALPAEPSHHNQAFVIALSRAVAPGTLERALGELLNHHDMLRARFEQSEDGWRAHVPAGVPSIALEMHDLSELAPAEHVAELSRIGGRLQTSLDIFEGRLVAVALVRRGASAPDALILVIHHLAVDAVSWRILLSDLQAITEQLERAETPSLPRRSTPYGTWAARLCEYASSLTPADVGYWLDRREATLNRIPVAAGFEVARNTHGAAATQVLAWSADETDRLLNAARQLQSRPDELLIAALALAAHNGAGASCIAIDLESHGREDIQPGIDLSRTVGWFTSVYPVYLKLVPGGTPAEFLRSVKEELRAVPQRGIGYGAARHLRADAPWARELAAMPDPDLTFNYLGTLDGHTDAESWLRITSEDAGPAAHPENRRSHLIDINAGVLDGRLRLGITHSPAAHGSDEIAALAQRLRAALSQLAACDQPADALVSSDFPLAQLTADDFNTLRTRFGARGIEDVYPLAPLQKGMLYHAMAEPDSAVFVTQFRCGLSAEVNLDAFCAAWREVVARNPVLRTAFHVGEQSAPQQVVCRRVELACVIEDWRELADGERTSRLAAKVQSERQTPFTLHQPSLMRLSFVRTSDARYEFIWTHHHVLFDGWSLPLLLEEVFALYQQRCGGATPPPCRRPFRDYIAWLSRQDQVAAERFWREELAGFEAATPLPFDDGPAADETRCFDEQTWELESAIARDLHTTAQRHRLTVNTLCASAWALVLARHAGLDDVVFGLTVAGRPPELDGIEDMIGLFINGLPLRVRPDDRRPAIDWLNTVQAAQTRISQYQYSSLLDIQGYSEIPHGTALFESTMVFENYPVEAGLGERARSVGILDVTSESYPGSPLHLRVLPGEQGLTLRLVHETGRVSAESAQRLVRQVACVLAQLAADLRQPVGALRLDLPEDAAVLPDPRVALRCAAEVPIELFRAQVVRSPEAVALVCGARRCTYAELRGRVDAVARALAALGVTSGAAVVLAGVAGLGLTTGLLGVLASGGAGLVLDGMLPRRRLAQMLELAEARYLVYVGSARAGGADAWLWAEAGLKVLWLCPESGELTDAAQRAAGEAGPLPAVDPDGAAYIAFTSGTTGVPKGVRGVQRGLADFLVWQREEFGIGRGDRGVQLTAPGVDVVYREALLPLVSGGTLYIPEVGEVEGVDRTLGWLERVGVTVLLGVPSVVQTWLAEELSGVELKHVRWLFLVGEKLTDGVVGRWRRRYAGQIVNLYGATETTMARCRYVVPAAVRGGVQPVGGAIRGTQVLVVGAGPRLCGIGEVGELVFRLPFRALGYVGEPSGGVSRYEVNPWREDPDDRLYCTGDLGRRLPDGTLELLGRRDEQVKVHGVRVEPAEVAGVLEEHPEVSRSVVVGREDRGGLMGLVAYVVPRKAGGVPAEELIGHLRSRLPLVMVPGRIVFLDDLPCTRTGKIDVRALPAAETEFTGDTSTLRPPTTAVEHVLARIWAGVLKLERVGTNDDFFRLGGHSLLAMQIVARLRDTLRIDVPIRLVFEAPTIESFVAALGREVIDADELKQTAEMYLELEGLSDEQLEELLRAQTGQERRNATQKDHV